MKDPTVADDLLMYGVSFELDGQRVHPSRVSVTRNKEVSVPWWQYWYEQGDPTTANDVAAFEKANQWLRANLSKP